MKLFTIRKSANWSTDWKSESIIYMNGMFYYWAKKRNRRPSMEEYLLDTELRNLLADLRRAVIDGERKRNERLRERIDVCMFEFYRLRIGRKLSL